MKENEFGNTKDHDIFNDLSSFVASHEKNSDVLYHFTLMELYNFFNNLIDVDQSITINESSEEEDY